MVSVLSSGLKRTGNLITPRIRNIIIAGDGGGGQPIQVLNATATLSSSQSESCMISARRPCHCGVANERIVYSSSSNNIYENLSLEEWIYEHTDFSQRDVLLLWQSDPCVVIGKHQNPWIEANLPALDSQAVHLARRSSGGGTVYHDQGNLNLSFLKDRSRYNRRENLELVVAALKSKWDLDLVVNERDDIILDGVHKISGTAAKLTRNKSYHHFTLLHNVDRAKLSSCLASPFRDYGDPRLKNPGGVSIHSRSTKSVPAPIQNLQARAPEMTFDLLMEVIVREFLGDHKATMTEAVTLVDPLDERLFPGVTAIYHRLQSWDWLFGKTPKFSINVKLDSPTTPHVGNGFVKSVEINVEKGCMVSLNVILNDDDDENTINLASLFSEVNGVKLTKENLCSLADLQRWDISGLETFSQAYPDMDVECVLESVRVAIIEDLLGRLL